MAERILTAESPWSFSKLSCFDECPYCFYLQYMQDPPLPQQGNAWSDYGTLNILTQINNCLNIQLRNLLTLMEF